MEQANGDKWYLRQCPEMSRRWRAWRRRLLNTAGHAPSAFKVVTWGRSCLAPWLKTWGMPDYSAAFTNICSPTGTQACSSRLLVFLPPQELPSACYSTFLHPLSLLMTSRAFISALFNHATRTEKILVEASNYLKNSQRQQSVVTRQLWIRTVPASVRKNSRVWEEALWPETSR